MLRMKKRRKKLPQTSRYGVVDEAEEEAEEAAAISAFCEEGFDPIIETSDIEKKESPDTEAPGSGDASLSGWESLAARAQQQRERKRSASEVKSEVSHHKCFMEDLGKHAKAIGFMPNFALMDVMKDASVATGPGTEGLEETEVLQVLDQEQQE